MTEYYKTLYDINFFSEDEYQNDIEGINVSTTFPDSVLWSTWNSSNVSAKQAEKTYSIARNSIDGIHLMWESMKQYPKEYNLIMLLISENAYRTDNEKILIKCYNILKVAEFAYIRLKAEKLMASFKALKLLASKMNSIQQNSQSRIENIQLHALNFINTKENKNYSLNDFKVELPVLADWENRNMNFDNPTRVEEFYKSTDSYVLELIAANHQVETLFNYSIVVNKLLELGVTNIYDYAGGIGTFSIFSKLNGISVIFSELDSVTRNYAITRIQDSKVNIQTEILEYDNPNLKSDIPCIVCTEVLEHIYEPEDLIKYFYSKLSKRGILVISESFDYIENFCTHLPKHKGKSGEVFLKFMESVGFEKINLNYDIHPDIFRKK